MPGMKSLMTMRKRFRATKRNLGAALFYARLNSTSMNSWI